MSFSKIKKIPTNVLVGLFCFLFLIVSFSGGYFIGESQAARKIVPIGEARVTGQGSVSAALAKDIDFKNFWDIWNLSKEKFYKQPVSDKDLYYGALKGLVSGLHDPYSVYFDPEEAKKFNEDLSESFVGIGAQIGIKDERLTVIAPLDDSPATKAGLQSGDWIVTIDGTETSGMSVEEAVSKIRGEDGTSVTLQVSRKGLDVLKEIKIIRQKITVDSVKWKIEDGNIMTISISTFNGDTSSLFSNAVQEALSKNVKGIILDLRGDPGGLLTAAVDVASAWVGYDPVVSEKGKSVGNTFNGVTAPRLSGIPTVVLVDGGSASASEIVSGALQDYAYAKLVGVKTFGKGSVQDYQDLPDGSAIKITTAEWFTPKGRNINKTGIEPDVNVVFDAEAYKKNQHDNQKQTARDVLLGTYKPAVATTSAANKK
ncbi:MAG: S41 family peptidase [Candidatus Uhrbacteria bacterium]|nr:S41 family peptidase [Candidatus Uhrbacteria bacterium]